MDLDVLKNIFNGTALPEPGLLLDKLEPVMWVLLLVGPILMVVMGMIYSFAAPDEANHHFGYRCYFGMGSIQAWQFTQHLAGGIWLSLGVCLGLAMVLVKHFVMPQLEIMDMLAYGLVCLLVQVGALLLATIVIRVIVACTFDRHGARRRDKRQKTA